MMTGIATKLGFGRIRDMWELHLRSRLLRILEDHRILVGERLTRNEWLELASKKIWVWFHYPLLALFNRDAFVRKIDKVLNTCIPPHDRFSNMPHNERDRYYTTFPEYPNETLEITNKGLRFVGTGGYEQRVVELYGKGWPLFIAFISGIISLGIWNIILDFIQKGVEKL